MQLASKVISVVVLMGCDPQPLSRVESERLTSVSAVSSSSATASAIASSSVSANPSAASNALPARVFKTPQRTLDCSNYFGCAVLGERLACWGYNQFGQLGKPAVKYPRKGSAFVNVPSPMAVAVGFTHGCALSAEGDVHCWGSSSDGALGDGVLPPPDEPSSRVIAPTKVKGLGAKAVDLDVGNSHSCVVLEDGGVACWGANYADVLGVGEPSSAKPVRISGVLGAVEVATSDDLTCARTAPGDVICWGRGKSAPEPVAGACAKQLTIASSAACALDCAGSVSCWLSHFIARDRAGQVLAWGGNDSGQIGNGKPASWDSAFADKPVTLSTGWKAGAVCAGGIVARPDGRDYLRPSSFVDTGISCAATSTGEVHCWGEPDLDYVPKAVELPKERATR
jgi:alpha-tubulin suppressor-like RCC1 family protein